MFFLNLTPEEQKQLIELLGKSGLTISNSPLDVITTNQFFILSIALALSTYISTVSREVIRSLRKDINQGRKERIPRKRTELGVLIIGDILLWPIIISIIGYISNHINNNLPKSLVIKYPIVGFLFDLGNAAKLINDCIVLATIFMLIVHVIQWGMNIRAIFQRPRNNYLLKENLSELIFDSDPALNANDLKVYTFLAQQGLLRGNQNENLINVDNTIKLAIAAKFNLTVLDPATNNINEPATIRAVDGILANLTNNGKLAAQGNLYRFL